MKSNINFTPSSKQGYSIKNGLLYEFKRNSVNVSRPWPPCKYTKTSRKPFWHYSPTHKITLHFMALKYSVNLEKGMIALGSSEVLEGESPKVVKSADENRKMIEEAFWARYALPAVGSEDDPYWQKSFANQRKWTPVIASFYDKIPLNVREMMLANTEGAWNICAFYARCPGADELMNTSPAIGFMLSNFPVFRPKLKRKWDAVRRIMNKPRRKILSWLGWPDSEAVAKILSKIRYQACDRTALLMLRAILKKNPALIKPISHIKAINALSLGFICRNSYRKHASWRFISELALIGEEIDDNMNNKALGIQRMFIDTLSMEKMLLATHGQIQSIAHLRKRHQLAIDEVNRHEISELEKSKAFPSPPVPAPLPTDNFEIYPLDSPLKLYKEAQEQHNCVFACYRERVVESEGNIYIYSMRKPERATVEVEFDSESKSFLPGEVKGPSNKPVSTDTVAKIIVWLSTMGKKSDAITYDENPHDRLLPAFPITVPNPDDSFNVRQIIRLKHLLSEMRHFNIAPEANTMLQIEQGRIFAFQMDAPEKAFVFITKDKCGTFTYSAFKKIRISEIGHCTKSRLEEWMEDATIGNIAICNPDQLDLGFADVAHFPIEQESSMLDKRKSQEFLRFLPQTYTDEGMF